METEDSLLRLQEPATCPYPKPDQSSPCPSVALHEDPPYYPPIYARNFQVVSFPQVSPPKLCIHLSSPTIPATCPATLIGMKYCSTYS